MFLRLKVHQYTYENLHLSNIWYSFQIYFSIQEQCQYISVFCLQIFHTSCVYKNGDGGCLPTKIQNFKILTTQRGIFQEKNP